MEVIIQLQMKSNVQDFEINKMSDDNSRTHIQKKHNIYPDTGTGGLLRLLNLRPTRFDGER
jgi:hypothetical protein